MKRTLANTPDTTDHLIKLRNYGPLRTGSMNTQVQAVHSQTATHTLRFGALPYLRATFSIKIYNSL